MSPQEQANPNVARSVSFDFSKLASSIAATVGSSWTFVAACGGILVWGISGPFFHFSDTWQLIVNTATTIITFLMVFLIQNTQNRDTRALHLKLDEIIRSHHHAHNEMIDIEKLSDGELQELSDYFQKIREACEHRAIHLTDEGNKNTSAA